MQDFRTSASKGTYYSPENAEINAKLVAKVKALADAKGCAPGQLAIAWVHSRGTDVVAIPGDLPASQLLALLICAPAPAHLHEQRTCHQHVRPSMHTSCQCIKLFLAHLS